MGAWVEFIGTMGILDGDAALTTMEPIDYNKHVIALNLSFKKLSESSLESC